MALPLEVIQSFCEHGLVGINGWRVWRLFCDRLQALTRHSADEPPILLLAESDPVNFLAGFLAALAAEAPVVLGSSDWKKTEWQQVFTLVKPDVIWGAVPDRPEMSSPHRPDRGWIMIPTGGSSGEIRFVIHTWETLTAAVAGFQAFFGVDRVNCCCVLPFHHVSGLMQVVRSLRSGGRLAVFDSKRLVEQWRTIDPSQFFLSLVPTQLQQLLDDPIAVPTLAQFQTIFLGGAPAWNDLLHRARQQMIRLAPTYGMTETAAQVATLKPAEFLAGQTGCGRSLPHVQFTFTEAGCLAIQSRSLALGYYPDRFWNGRFETDDLGYFDGEGSLHLVGRNSQKIITGGENVFPAEVEAAIRSTGLVQDVCVVGVPDRHWGEIVTALYIPAPGISTVQIQIALIGQLCRYKQPKRWLEMSELPRNAQGKVNLDRIRKLVVL